MILVAKLLKLVNYLVFKCLLPYEAELAGEVDMRHWALGVVVHPQVRIGKNVTIMGYMVTIKTTSTRKGESMYFGTFYDQAGEVFDTIHFPDSARKFPFRGRGFYSIKGKVVEDFGVHMVEVHWMDKIPMISKRAEEHMRETIFSTND